MSVSSDDISSIVTMRGEIGVMWSDQLSQSFRFVTHTDGAPDTAGGWGALEKPLAGTRLADDHISLKGIVSDDDGRLYAAVKTSLGDDPSDPSTGALVALVVRSGAGDWSSHTFGTVADDHTRPMVLLDESNRQIYVFATWPVGGGSIYYKTSPMANISFGPGRGTKFVTWAGARINDASSTKQPVNTGSGIVVLASDMYAFRYYHSELSLGPADAQAPSVPTGLRATAASPTRVDLAWSAATDDVGVARLHRLSQRHVAGDHHIGVVLGRGGGARHHLQLHRRRGRRRREPLGAERSRLGDDPPGPGPAITLRGSSFSANATATTLSIAAPAGARAGDVEVMAIAARGAPRFTAPSGWTLVRQDSNGFTMTQAMYTHVVGANEPASYTWTLSSAQSAAGGIIAYGGVRTVSPVDSAGGQANASATSVTAPSIVTSKRRRAARRVLRHRCRHHVDRPGGDDRARRRRERRHLQGDARGRRRARAAAGPTGATVAKAVNAAANVGQLVALSP